MDVLFVSPEIVPFSKVGGLADVVGALPKALRALGHKVTVLSLLHGSIDPSAHALARRLARIAVPLGRETVQAEVYETRLPSGVQVTLLSAPGLTDRAAVYGEPDDARRFAFLSRGAIAWMRAQSKLPDVIHAHDWATGLVPLFLAQARVEDDKLARIKTVFTIHNLGHQGLFPASVLAEIGLPESYFAPEKLEFYGEVSFLKAGVLFADRVTTVSPGYAKEIVTPGGGMRFDGMLRARGKDLAGIINGVDYAIWNPATDPGLAARYDAEDLGPKARDKNDLLASLGLTAGPATPLFGFIGRLDPQKGADVILEAASRLIRQELQLVVLGDGDPGIAAGFADLAKRFPERVAFKSGFDDALAHRIYAGSDFFLAPARFEPCGLTHMYAMRYGAVPVARATGGLRDTVLDCDAQLESGTGFLFERPDADELAGAVGRALTAYGRRDAFAKLVRRVMRRDVSWERSARQYQSLYASLVG